MARPLIIIMQSLDPQQRAVDSTTALQKVLRLDKKHTNFDYVDTLRRTTLRVNYPQTLPQGPSSDVLLRSLWRHVANYYFKPIEESEWVRLEYLQKVLTSQTQGGYRFEGDRQFWQSIQAIFTQTYLHRYVQSQTAKLHHHNWLQTVFLYWQTALSSQGKAQKKIFNELGSIRKHIQAMDDDDQMVKLNREKRLLGGMLREEEILYDQVGAQIMRLEAELQENNSQIEGILDQIREKVRHQTTIKDILYCQGETSQQVQTLDQRSKVQHQLTKLTLFETLNNFIQYTVRQLQHKQIAESIAKLVRTQKVKGQVRVHLVFQAAMGLKTTVVSQSQFKQLNNLREYSLLNFYNTVTKSPYSFICQNYLGFKDMYENRTGPCKLKNKDVMQQMKNTPLDPANAPYNKQFGKMDICHHCKLLHPEHFLVKCEYRSNRCGNPIPPSPYYDSYVHQILKNEQSRTTAIRFLNSNVYRKNSYFFYNKQGQQYVCGRKYCKFCLKNYDDGKQKHGGLCPYCRGICYCTRCSRNDVMIRLKSMFVLMGGDINRLQSQSLLERFYGNNPDEQMELRNKEKQSKSKRMVVQAPRTSEKMINLRYQLEDLRMICDLVKRRQKHKQKLLACQKQTFRQKLAILNFEVGDLQDKQSKIEDRRSKIQDRRSKVEVDGQEIVLTEKQSKKLKRLIS